MRIEILPSAWESLARIKYRVQADFDEDVALNVTDHILDSLERLEQFQDSGSMTPDPWLNAMGFQGGFASGKAGSAFGRTADDSIQGIEARHRMVISDKRNMSIFRKVDESIFVYIIADTRTEYAKVFKDMIVSDPGILAKDE